MKRIFKFKIYLTDQQVIEIPKGAKLLTVRKHYDEIMLWVEIDTVEPDCFREINIVGTGMSPPPGVYLTTILDGSLVWHIYDGGEISTPTGSTK